MLKIPESGSQTKSVIREYIEAICIALVIALFIRTFVVQAFKIPSGSMIPTLLIGDHILVNKFIYGIRNPFSGDIWIHNKNVSHDDVIVFKYPVNPDQDFIKRVVGVPGDKIQIVNKKVYVNEKQVENPNTVQLDRNIFPPGSQPRDNFGPVVVPDASYFVMGDNRDNSHDSRFWGFVNDKAIKGKAFILYWSWDRENFSIRWNRFGKLIH